MSRHTPPGVVIDEAATVLQFRGDTDAYLTHGSGKASLNLLSLAREGLESGLAAGDRRGARQRRDRDPPDVTVATPAGRPGSTLLSSR